MAGNSNGTLYEDVRELISRKIYEGEFREGENLPAERTLAQMLKVSRITLRKSLELLADRGLVVKEPGSGNRVELPNCGMPGSMDMIVLVAPAENPFFAEFIRAFQEYGQECGTMVLYAEKPRKETLVDSIYRFYQKQLYNIVIWPEDAKVDQEKLRRLRALGMNMAFFDTDRGMPYADAVVLDNQRAVRELHRQLWERGVRKIGYVGWENGPVYSGRLREQTILEAEGTGILLKLPWEKRKEAGTLAYEYLNSHREELPPGIVFCDWECGFAVSSALRAMGRKDILLAGIDDFPGSEEAGAIVCKQDVRETVKGIFRCMESQNREGSRWKAEIRYIQGHIKDMAAGKL